MLAEEYNGRALQYFPTHSVSVLVTTRNKVSLKLQSIPWAQVKYV